MSVQDTTTSTAASAPASCSATPRPRRSRRCWTRRAATTCGCASPSSPAAAPGLRYQLFFDERFLDGDQTYEFGGVEVIVDRMSGPYLGGATIDFVDTIEKQGFTIDNPNARRLLRLRRQLPLSEHRSARTQRPVPLEGPDAASIPGLGRSSSLRAGRGRRSPGSRA